MCDVQMGRIMDRRVAVQRPSNALVLAEHALGGPGVRQHVVDRAHALRIQPCPCSERSDTAST